MRIFSLTILLLINCSAFADIPYHPRAELISRGYQKVEKNISYQRVSTLVDDNIYEYRSLPWPIALKREPQQFIGNMHQFQTFTNPSYYHGGVDVLAHEEQVVTTPVSGVIEGVYYSYSDDYFGNAEKFEIHLRDIVNGFVEQPSDKRYFEVAIIDEQGNRFEFHHINPDTLPDEIRQKILLGDSWVSAGTIIGSVIDFRSRRGKIDMDHLHYNIVNHQGYYLNPFHFSKTINDDSPPQLTNIYAAKKSFCHQTPELVEFSDDHPLETEKMIVVRTLDLIGKELFSQAPMIIHAKFSDGEEFMWDFSTSIVDQTGNRPWIREVYLHSKCIAGLGELRASNNSDFYFKIPVPSRFHGSIEVTVYDQNFNFTTKTVHVQGPTI